MNYEWDFSFLLQYKGLIAIGALYTIGFTIVTAIAGFVVGGLIAVARLANARVVTIPLLAFIEIFRCTPVLVQLVWIYYALPIVIGVELKPATAAFIALTLYGASFFAEIIRGGIASIDTGQWDAGRALGMRRAALMRRVVLPQALKRMIPPLVNQVVLQLKNTSLLSVLAVPDLLYQGQLITSATYKPLEVYTMIAIIYFIILFPLTTLAHGLERRLAR
ncbi:ABC transporter permease [Methylobacterium indicum]|uniref:Glutamate/aspartate import permease protein GltK n=1 Tax=Methylobacterium indicum TaxID=1775910 RepID=A0A0J6TRZ8_9HYPH|nr:amino acid ABC transporter permease [Methylobacterium indicum]KMO15341.1 ABC transporter permease [Methylobacterium indicum]KMO18186.1 ABC transporter permease [Methylobacterium indicum]KTS28189.1 ABC transporter permease [Methylobacterium indicum]KTS30633.1 ABC transporter permease [Methylobacterium indicum]KTS53262.1 ABC transporter permease [Methylobacterium indicum]